MEKVCGIYKIENLVNGKMYIGSASAVSKRLTRHKSELKHGNHKNEHLQCAWNKYGGGNFKFVKLFECEEHERVGTLGYEQALFDLLWEYGLLYNINSVAELLTPPKPVCSWDLDGIFLKRYDSIIAGARDTGAMDSRISQVCNGKARTAGKLFWTYADRELIIQSKHKPTGGGSKFPCAYYENGDLFKKFKSANEAGYLLGVRGSTIRNACQGRRRTLKGFFWAYDGENPNIRDCEEPEKYRTGMYKDGELIRIFESSAEAGRETGIPQGGISNSCRSKGKYIYKGFSWIYMDKV